MKEYLEQCLRKKVEMIEFEKNKSLPLIYSGLYLLFSIPQNFPPFCNFLIFNFIYISCSFNLVKISLIIGFLTQSLSLN